MAIQKRKKFFSNNTEMITEPQRKSKQKQERLNKLKPIKQTLNAYLDVNIDEITRRLENTLSSEESIDGIIIEQKLKKLEDILVARFENYRKNQVLTKDSAKQYIKFCLIEFVTENYNPSIATRILENIEMEDAFLFHTTFKK